ncbi:sulfoxide reductase heme-binding subunit YedZ [Rhizobium leguminosarum]|uniref:Protein-methionine-sulfoxide reductase heme-binding subunit MsrQ n=1 Tax=Rhizobium leguminosarum TaxID=384 RepID=A0AAE2MHN7_RHILE|nr:MULTISPECIES: protein-methionine-sulfoxide reductase heme-binding subunit MsrQ [Rhizobium]MBB4289553.1 sulfoxide reductase heme-binding subunit YedZ [Rhizobium leguminosarum]MBB4294350.1 sulfoxide reductase heme-binding subunit YedZ [Rhizobium leguminosarum]MBB4305747.1 sulfoxide reductase heme-binding subunit YedZ [Rhizobium leguminosarum]MBB4418676.1 sulfoxide reductase heme-binding subunit YedZ [Rhizobium leguminosarum]MBB4433521.1 sulfoxide reductase heme-binding subunit YedZ [Rhizobium
MAELSLAIPKRWQPASIWLLYVVGLAPAAWTFYLGATDQLGADPVKTFELFLGIWTIRFLIATLAVSPARELFGWNYLRYRRALGLLTFYYALMHFTVYMVLDQAMDIPAVINDVLKRPFIMFGMAGLAMLIPLALTSNNFSIRRLGKNWIWLHRLVYIIAASGALHFALSTKILDLEQYIYVGLIIALILYRSYRPIARSRKKGQGRPRNRAVASPSEA